MVQSVPAVTPVIQVRGELDEDREGEGGGQGGGGTEGRPGLGGRTLQKVCSHLLEIPSGIPSVPRRGRRRCAGAQCLDTGYDKMALPSKGTPIEVWHLLFLRL